MNTNMNLSNEMNFFAEAVELPVRELADLEVVLIGGGEVTGSTY
jgi:hypothetical protein